MDQLDTLPDDRPVALVLRHGERPPIAAGTTGAGVLLTERGTLQSQRLGAALGARLGSLRASPVRRCQQTAECIRAGAGGSGAIADDRLLGGPGVFVADGQLAWRNWQEIGNAGVIEHLMAEDTPLPGMCPAMAATRRLLDHVIARLDGAPVVHILVTHDSILTPFTARLLGRPLSRLEWPGFLAYVAIWRAGDRHMARYRDLSWELPFA